MYIRMDGEESDREVCIVGWWGETRDREVCI